MLGMNCGFDENLASKDLVISSMEHDVKHITTESVTDVGLYSITKERTR